MLHHSCELYVIVARIYKHACHVGDGDIHVECGVPSSHWLINYMYERKGKRDLTTRVKI